MYFCNMNTNHSAYDEARRAAVESNDPIAYLRLGIIYFYGTHTERNVVLARYFIGKAISMCSGKPEMTALIRKHLQEECDTGNFGLLSVAHSYLSKFYPSFSRKKAIEDFMADKDTFAAKVLYSQCTSNNTSEILIHQQESLLRQLYAPIIPNDSFWSTKTIDSVLARDEGELTVCLDNFKETYQEVCDKYNIDKQDILHLDPTALFPYISPTTLYRLRRQIFKCILSFRHLDPLITRKYLTHLCDNEYLLDICPKIKDYDAVFLLISFVELNMDIEAIGLTHLKLLRSFQNDDLEPLVAHINECINRLTKAGISHPFHPFTKETLPTITL